MKNELTVSSEPHHAHSKMLICRAELAESNMLIAGVSTST